jgi:deoxyribonuclease V
MIAALDVHYNETALTGQAAAVVFRHWEDADPLREYAVMCNGVEPYVPGQFYKRELSCLLAVLNAVDEPLDLIVVDGYVSLGGQPGLGQHLFEALHGKTPVVGVAKTSFHAAQAIEVTRGASHSPLYVTAVGMDPGEAAAKVGAMAGNYRIPALLKRVDQLARSAST